MTNRKPKPAADELWQISFTAGFMEKVDESAKQNGRTAGKEIEFRVQRDLDRELIATTNTAKALKKRGAVLLRKTRGVKLSRLPKRHQETE